MQSAQLMDGLLSCEQVSPRIHNLGLFSDLQQQQLNCLYMYRLCFIGSNTELGRNLQSLKVHRSHAHYIIPYSGNFSGRKLSRISRFIWLSVKVFSAKFGDVASLAAPVSNSRKFSLWKSYFPPICESFLPRTFPPISWACTCTCLHPERNDNTQTSIYRSVLNTIQYVHMVVCHSQGM